MHIQQSCELKQRSTADQRYPRGLLYSLNNNKNISTNSCKQHLSLENKYKMQLITFHGVGLVFMWATKWWRDEQSRGRLQMISCIMSCGDAGGDMERFLFFSFFYFFFKVAVCKVLSFLEAQHTFGSSQKQQDKYIDTRSRPNIWRGVFWKLTVYRLHGRTRCGK